MREAIVDLAERVGVAALTKTHGSLSPEDTERFRDNLKARLDREEVHYPIRYSLATAIPDVLGQGKLAEIATSRSIRQKEGNGPEFFATPLTDMWQQVIQEEASLAAQEHWGKADALFRGGQATEAARELTHAVVCMVAATAALKGWPHAGDEQIHNAISILAGGVKPEQPSKGEDLTNAYGASVGFSDLLMYDPMGRTLEEAEADARYYAELATDLIKELSGRQW